MKKRFKVVAVLFIVAVIYVEAFAGYMSYLNHDSNDLHALQSYMDNVRDVVYVDYYNRNEYELYKSVYSAMSDGSHANVTYEIVQGGQQVRGVETVEDADNMYYALVPKGLEKCSPWVQAWINTDAWKTIGCQCNSERYETRYWCLKQVNIYETALLRSKTYSLFIAMDSRINLCHALAAMLLVILALIWMGMTGYLKLEEDEDEHDGHDEVNTGDGGDTGDLHTAEGCCCHEEPESEGCEGTSCGGQCKCDGGCSHHCHGDSDNQGESGDNASFEKYVEAAALHRERNE